MSCVNKQPLPQGTLLQGGGQGAHVGGCGRESALRLSQVMHAFFQTVPFVGQIVFSSFKETQSAAHNVSLAGSRAHCWVGTSGTGVWVATGGDGDQDSQLPRELQCLLLFQMYGYAGFLPDAKANATMLGG